jgi:acetyltransferase-like isoleucine patch superfamily enzyme
MLKLKRIGSKIVCMFVPKKSLRHRFIANSSESNKIILIKNGKEHTARWFEGVDGIDVSFFGKGNTVKLNLPIKACGCRISFKADNCLVEMGPSNQLENIKIYCHNGEGQVCKIGKNTTAWGAEISLSANCGCIIGEDCMLSKDINIRTTDGHIIADKNTGAVLNQPKGYVTIGNHCWIGRGVDITKNARVPANTIIGIKSLVTKDFKQEYTAIFGVPAEVKKTGTTWYRDEFKYIEGLQA